MNEKPPYETQFPVLNAPNLIPQAEHLRDRWTPTMEHWGTSMKNSYVKLLFFFRSSLIFS
jgi:hypothetical protein